MVDVLYTIGYSGFDIDAFVSVLRNKNVTVLIDVRSKPYSTYFPNYNKEILEKSLGKNGILYRNYSREFGAQQMNRAFCSPEGFLDFETFVKSDVFAEGFSKLENGMKQNYTFALMCAEKNPVDCHRAIMVSRPFHEAGHMVIHLLPDDAAMTQDDIEENMLDKYFPNRKQLTMFEFDDDRSTLIANAYHIKNAEIGFRTEEQMAI
ncbi:MAG: DUF488 domain-containing protein [Oscillospiraceae bacterium]|nr:DUF488 domain-containing protein [Oscillospiraceae bacterium]